MDNRFFENPIVCAEGRYVEGGSKDDARPEKRAAIFIGPEFGTVSRAEIDPEAWATLCGDTSRPFPRPGSGRIAVKVINHLGDEVMKVFRI